MKISEDQIRRIFRVSVVLKGIDAFVECAAGVALALISTQTIVNLVNFVTQEELVEDPHDFIATHLVAIAQHFSIQSRHFYAFYLLGHGVVKLALVAGLLKGKLWSFPASLVVLGLFVVYQLYRFSYTHSVGLLALTIFDIFVMVLIWHEYGLARRHVRTG